ncbi:MAG TPA: recombination mediator RecR [Anaerohalosphaeraceae bacterium]|nr:recombination mediator RecR [Anaerohalosphaeraceae bacterium]HOL32400.1 recombination mediator RecR [Anaerohalosphaeraceae bacterium]HOM76138.1 recombination mediator RecR [Anaerohalosphaeraceae bacterium]HPC63196.1 recombination mediator RecR [Anaerohalosphaeraceae bacterium]HPO70052.1 recombination mediator RecR [Anaerohalosphaeraceae bacterium]
MNPAYTKTLNELVEQFAKLPGIGPKTAERLAFHILKSSTDEAMALSQAISNVKSRIQQCQICYNLAESEICGICSDSRRDKSVICVVEQPKDVISLEKTGLCKWVYHVLNGHIAPLEGIEPEDLTIEALLNRVRQGSVKEVIMATNPNLEGDGTSLYIHSLLRPFGIKITKLARGLPAGSTIEFSSGSILTDAILNRSEF